MYFGFGSQFKGIARLAEFPQLIVTVLFLTELIFVVCFRGLCFLEFLSLLTVLSPLLYQVTRVYRI